LFVHNFIYITQIYKENESTSRVRIGPTENYTNLINTYNKSSLEFQVTTTRLFYLHHN